MTFVFILCDFPQVYLHVADELTLCDIIWWMFLIPVLCNDLYLMQVMFNLMVLFNKNKLYY